MSDKTSQDGGAFFTNTPAKNLEDVLLKYNDALINAGGKFMTSTHATDVNGNKINNYVAIFVASTDSNKTNQQVLDEMWQSTKTYRRK